MRFRAAAERAFMIAIVLGVYLLTAGGFKEAQAKQTLAIYAGPGSPLPLIEIARFKEFELVPQSIITVAFAHTMLSDEENFALEIEAQITKYTEALDLFSMNTAVVARWLKTPWQSALGGGSVAFGNGLSYATGVPTLDESSLTQTSRILYHILLEAALPLGGLLGSTSTARSWAHAWEAFFRIHHRSGAFGLFNGAVGGSDYLCLGMRYRLN